MDGFRQATQLAERTDTETTDSIPDTESALVEADHDLVTVTERVPGPEPTDYDVDLSSKRSHVTRYWRCQRCGQERTSPDEFGECVDEALRSPLDRLGYTVLEDRTRRALLEDMVVHYGERGPTYRVDSQSGTTYEVNVERETCTCPDFHKRGEDLADGCKHLRRVNVEIAAGHVAAPDGRLQRTAPLQPSS